MPEVKPPLVAFAAFAIRQFFGTSYIALRVVSALAAAAVLLLAEATGRADVFADAMPGYASLLAFFGRVERLMLDDGRVGKVGGFRCRRRLNFRKH